MRWVYLAIVILFAAAAIIFAIQNREVATVAFLGFSIRAPLAALIIGVYALGAITGGSLFALLRASVEKSKQVRA